MKLGNPHPETAGFTIAPRPRKRAQREKPARSGEDLPGDPAAAGENWGYANAAAAELNRRGVQTARGNGKWTARAVLNLKARRAPA